MFVALPQQDQPLLLPVYEEPPLPKTGVEGFQEEVIRI